MSKSPAWSVVGVKNHGGDGRPLSIRSYEDGDPLDDVFVVVESTRLRDALLSDKAVEAAAKGIRRLGDTKGTDRSWDEHTTEFKRNVYRKWGRAALTAAVESVEGEHRRIDSTMEGPGLCSCGAVFASLDALRQHIREPDTDA